MNGVDHIASAFQKASNEKRAALIPYLTLGFPDGPASLDAVVEAARAGADVIELGVPFSDPLADGPTIQHSTQVALNHHISVASCLELAAEARRSGVTCPLLFMGYINPIFAYGVERFARDSAAAGVDGFIIPDMPPEESSRLEQACREKGLALVYLVSPASPQERIEMVARRTSGFLYLTALTGVTGARRQLSTSLPEFIARARSVAQTPIAVGFGISSPAQAAEVGRLADGVIVGSALINAMDTAIHTGSDPVAAAGSFIGDLRRGLEPVEI